MEGAQIKAEISRIIREEFARFPKVVPPSDSEDFEAPLFGPDDGTNPLAVTSLATIAAGGTEVNKFNAPGILVGAPGMIGVYWATALKAAISNGGRWSPVVPGRTYAYSPHAGFFLGTSSTGVTPSGVVSLEFYKKPNNLTWGRFRDKVEKWTRGAGSDLGTAASSGATQGQSTYSAALALAENVPQGPFGAVGVQSTIVVDQNSAAQVFVTKTSLAGGSPGVAVAQGGSITVNGVFFIVTLSGLGATAYYIQG